MTEEQLEKRLECELRENAALMDDLRRVGDLGLPQCCIAAGYIRSYIWDLLHGYEPRGLHQDIDVVYFDPEQTNEERDVELERQLRSATGSGKWSVKNQARMHIRNGEAPYRSTLDAMSRWPETATAVGAGWDNGRITLYAPYGLEDLYALRVRRSPLFHDQAYYVQRVRQKGWSALWPRLTVVDG